MTYKALNQFISGAFLTGMLLLGSCVKEEMIGGTGPGPKEGDGYLSFNIDVKDLSASGRDADPADLIEEAENRVNSVRVILYDTATDPEVKYAFHFNISTNDANSPDGGGPGLPYDWYTDGGLYTPDGDGGRALYGNLPDETDGRLNKGRFVTYAQKIERRDYQMLVIINPTYQPGSMEQKTVEEMEQDAAPGSLNLYYLTRVGAKLSEFNAAFNMPHSMLYQPGSIACIMPVDGEAPNFVMTNSQGLIPVREAELPGSRVDAHNNPYAVKVDRVVAKVQVEVPTGGIKLTGNAGVDPDDMFFAPDNANLHSYWMRRMTYLKGTWPNGAEEILGHTERAYHYAEDPNFNGLFGGLPHEDNFEKPWSFPYKVGSYDPEHQLYLLENTLAPTRQAVSPEEYTRVVVRLRYSPDTGRIPLDAGQASGYYTYGNAAYSRSEMKTLYANLSDTDYPFPVGLREAMRNAESEHGAGFNDTDNWLEAFTAYGINYYSECINYFTIPIRHFDVPSGAGLTENASYGRFGVVRNNVYTISLNSLHGPGSPTLENPVYISAGVKIQPWGRIDKAVELGEESPVEELALVTYEYYYEDGVGDRHLFATTYDDSAQVGDGIPFTETIRDAKLGEVPAAGNFVFQSHDWTAIRTVTSDPGQNVVKIIYREDGSARTQPTFVYFVDERFQLLRPDGIPVYASGGGDPEIGTTVDFAMMFIMPGIYVPGYNVAIGSYYCDPPEGNIVSLLDPVESPSSAEVKEGKHFVILIQDNH